MAYLVMMTARLVELHRVLKPTGSLYLHCDPTASHYLKILLDMIFGGDNFRNEIIWQRRQDIHNRATRHMGRSHDVLLWYTKSALSKYNIQYLPYDEEYIRKAYNKRDQRGQYRLLPCTNETGGNKPYEFRGVVRAWRFSRERMQRMYQEDLLYQAKEGSPFQYKKYLHDAKGVPVQDIWMDLPGVRGGERLGYPRKSLKHYSSASSAPHQTKATSSLTPSAAAERRSRPPTNSDASGSASTSRTYPSPLQKYRLQDMFGFGFRRRLRGHRRANHRARRARTGDRFRQRRPLSV